MQGIPVLGALHKHSFGAPNVHYTADGRAVLAPADGSSYSGGRGSNRSAGMRGGGGGGGGGGYYGSYDRHKDQTRHYRNDKGYRRGSRDDSYGRSHRSKASPPSYKSYAADAPNHLGVNTDYKRYTHNGDWTGFDKAELITQQPPDGDRKGYRGHRLKRDWLRCGVLYVLLGVMLLVAGVINTMYCTHYHYYSRYWVGFMVLEFGIFCLLHKGNYESKWRNYDLVIMGVLTTALSIVGSSFLVQTLSRDLKLYGQLDGNSTLFKRAVILRDESPRMDVSSNATRVWLCLGNDGAGLGFYIISYGTLLVSAVTANKYWNYNHPTDHRCQPFFGKLLFNPFGQLPVAELVVLLGLLTRWACNGTEWAEYWAPVWAGGASVIAAGLSVASGKRPDKTVYNGFSLLTQLVALFACISAVVLCVMGIADNVNDLKKDDLDEGYPTKILVASATIFAIACIATLVCAFFCVGNIVRTLLNLMRYACLPPRGGSSYRGGAGGVGGGGSEYSGDGRAGVDNRGYMRRAAGASPTAGAPPHHQQYAYTDKDIATGYYGSGGNGSPSAVSPARYHASYVHGSSARPATPPPNTPAYVAQQSQTYLYPKY